MVTQRVLRNTSPNPPILVDLENTTHIDFISEFSDMTSHYLYLRYSPNVGQQKRGFSEFSDTGCSPISEKDTEKIYRREDWRRNGVSASSPANIRARAVSENGEEVPYIYIHREGYLGGPSMITWVLN